MNSLRTYVLGGLGTVWTAVLIIGASLVRSRRFPEIAREAPRRWAARILRAARVRVEIEGLEHLPADRPAIVVANHASWFDVFALAAYLPVDYRFVGKIELTRIPFFGPAWVSSGHIAIDRSNRERAIASLERAGEILRTDGAVVVMFPEGTRTRDGKLLPFKKGAFVLALKTGVPLVPVGIRGSRRIMPKGSWRIRPGTVHVQIGEPVDVEGLTTADRDALIEETRREVDRLRAESTAPLES